MQFETLNKLWTPLGLHRVCFCILQTSYFIFKLCRNSISSVFSCYEVQAWWTQRYFIW